LSSDFCPQATHPEDHQINLSFPYVVSVPLACESLSTRGFERMGHFLVFVKPFRLDDGDDADTLGQPGYQTAMKPSIKNF
jgi:hypothetical protein